MALPEPFGGFIVLAGILTLTIAGLIVGKRGYELRSRRQVFLGAGLIAAPWLFFFMVAILFPRVDEWNPAINSDSDITDDWQGDGYTVQLNPDFTF